jgi:hypothetical protein
MLVKNTNIGASAKTGIRNAFEAPLLGLMTNDSCSLEEMFLFV